MWKIEVWKSEFKQLKANSINTWILGLVLQPSAAPAVCCHSVLQIKIRVAKYFKSTLRTKTEVMVKSPSSGILMNLLAETVLGVLAQQAGKMWAHLFAGATCFCDTAAGACDPRALEPGFWTWDEVESQRGGSPCSRISQPKWRSRTARGARLRASSSALQAEAATAAPPQPSSPQRTQPLLLLMPPHATWTRVDGVNHTCCLSCGDRGICWSSLLFFSPSPSSLGLFVPWTREKFCSRRKQSSENKFGSSCWAISEGTGTAGSVPSNNICAIQAAGEGRGGGGEALTEGGWRPRGGSQRCLFSTVRYASLIKETDHSIDFLIHFYLPTNRIDFLLEKCKFDIIVFIIINCILTTECFDQLRWWHNSCLTFEIGVFYSWF